MRQRFRRPHKQSADLDITTFMNLMVILVPFLLITAVFNQVNILEMNLPPAKNEATPPPEEKPPIALEVILRKGSLQLNSEPGVPLKNFPLVGGEYDLQGLSQKLQQVKAVYPDELAITLLLEPDTPYEKLVQVMDTVRVVETKHKNTTTQSELFPEIALGDAPTNDDARTQ